MLKERVGNANGIVLPHVGVLEWWREPCGCLFLQYRLNKSLRLFRAQSFFKKEHVSSLTDQTPLQQLVVSWMFYSIVLVLDFATLELVHVDLVA